MARHRGEQFLLRLGRGVGPDVGFPVQGQGVRVVGGEGCSKLALITAALNVRECGPRGGRGVTEDGAVF